MVGEGGRRGEEMLEGWLVGVFVFYGGAETGLEIVTEIGAEVDLIERIFGFSGCGLRRERLNFLRGFALTIYVIEDGYRRFEFFENGVLGQFLVNHLLELDLVEREDTDHLH